MCTSNSFCALFYHQTRDMSQDTIMELARRFIDDSAAIDDMDDVSEIEDDNDGKICFQSIYY